MPELRYGRYFILEGSSQDLFDWVAANLSGDVEFYVCGVCDRSESFILNGMFEMASERDLFQAGFLKDQKDIGSVYNDRRDLSSSGRPMQNAAATLFVG